MRIKKWKVLHTDIVLENRWLKVRQDKCLLVNGSVIDDYYVVEKPDVVAVFAMTPDDKIVLVRQYKHGIKRVLIELPGGYAGTDEMLEKAASRELVEETGYSAPKFIKVCEFVDNPSGMNDRIHVYLARNATKQSFQQLDPNEHIEVLLMSLNKLIDSIQHGKICAQTSVAASYAVLNYLMGKAYSNNFKDPLRSK
jgi:8-oxo-dGTP pyrophosphatase MutT (NUDIX family)